MTKLILGVSWSILASISALAGLHVFDVFSWEKGVQKDGICKQGRCSCLEEEEKIFDACCMRLP